MGYYTSYSLSVQKPEWLDTKTKKIVEDLRTTIDEAGYAFGENGESLETLKWYAHREDIQVFSLKYPTCVFELSGEGEESGDLWKAYFKNGKSETVKAHIIYDPPSPFFSVN